MPGIVKHSSFAIPHDLIVLQYGHLSISTVQELSFGKLRPSLADSGCRLYGLGFTSFHTHLRESRVEGFSSRLLLHAFNREAFDMLR